MPAALNDKLIKAIKELGEKYAIEKIVLFGSRARGDNKPTSDIDLAVFTSKELARKGHFLSELDDLETLLKIDIAFITPDTDEPDFLERLKKEGVVLYER
jgi:predicted nucleotidyltransferase